MAMERIMILSSSLIPRVKFLLQRHKRHKFVIDKQVLEQMASFELRPPMVSGLWITEMQMDQLPKCAEMEFA